MIITTEHGSRMVLTIEDCEVIVESIYSKKKGDGKKLIEAAKQQSVDLGLALTLYAEPQDDSITQEGLRSFYYACGLILHPDDVDYNYFAYNL
jgi:hypothetical protein